MIRFDANISLLFTEVPFLDRFQRAAEAGFRAVEFFWPAGVDLDAVVAAKEAAGVEVALFNMDAGDMAAGDRGFLSHPDRQGWWRQAFGQACALARRLEARRIHAVVGNEIPGISRERQIACVAENLTWALPQLEEAGIVATIEPLNRFDNPQFLMFRSAHALALLDQLGKPPQVRLQYDVYHMQRMEGNLIDTIRANIDHIGHVQIADAPERHEPGTGEINFRNVLAALDAAGYAGYVGLEYNPRDTTEASLDWLPRDLRGALSVDELDRLWN